MNTERQAQMQEMERILRESLKYEYERNDAIKKEVKALEEICTLAIAACRDASPLLGEMLMTKAESIFQKPLIGDK